MWKPDYVTVQDLRAYTRILDGDDDVQLAFAATAASRAVDAHTGRQFGQVDAPEERLYTARFHRGHCRWVVDIDDLQDLTDLTISTDQGPITEFQTLPANAVARGEAFTRIAVAQGSTVRPDRQREGVAITALWGWSEFPTAVVQATLMQANRFFARRESPFGVAGSPEIGSELRLLARLDPDVAVSLRDYMRRVAL